MLKGKIAVVAVITGAGRGFGPAYARTAAPAAVVGQCVVTGDEGVTPATGGAP